MSVNTPDKPISRIPWLSPSALLISLCKGAALGFGLGVATVLKTLIIDSDYSVVLVVKEGLIPIGTTYVFYHAANQGLVKLGLTSKPAHTMGRFLVLLFGVVAFIAGMLLFIVAYAKMTALSHTLSEMGAEPTFDALLMLIWLGGILLLYKIARP